MISISEVLLKTANAIKADVSISSTCQNLFKKDIKVSVGSYEQNMLGEADAPFALVLADNEETSVNTSDLLQVKVRVVIGICPLRDVPSLTKLEETSSPVIGAVRAYQTAMNEFVDEFEEGEDKEYIQLEIQQIELRMPTLEAAVGDLPEHKEKANYPAIFEDYAVIANEADQLSYSMKRIVERFDREGSLPTNRALELFMTIKNCKYTLVDNRGLNNLAVARIDAVDEYNEYQENPYLCEPTVENGIFVSGAQRVMDDVRGKVVKAVSDVNYGMVIDSIGIESDSVSHYPLDWTNIIVALSQPDSLAM